MATYYVRTDGSDSNAGTGPATNQAWQTITKAIGATGIGPSDTLYIAPGVYRGAFTAAFTSPSSEGQRITIAGNPTASQFSGVAAGPVIITNYTSNTAATTGSILICNKDFTTLKDLSFCQFQPGAPPYYMCLEAQNTSFIVDQCLFWQASSNLTKYIVSLIVSPGLIGPTIRRSIFLNGPLAVSSASHSGAWNSQTRIQDCLVLNNNSNNINSNDGINLYSGTSGQLGGVQITNCTVSAANGIHVITNGLSSSFPSYIQNCYIEANLIGIKSDPTSTSTLIQTYNIINAPTSVQNVSNSGTTVTNTLNPINAGISKIQGWGDYPFISPLSTIQSAINAGINTYSPAADMFGTTWLAPSTPTIGASEFQSYTATGVYVPTERNASTITIAPGSTSQTIELYLGATGLTASTSGLSAYFNKNRTVDVAITLVARTISQPWVAGGFAEVNGTTMPGVYRLDIPNESISTGYINATIVVRGASGTNGAVVTIQEPQAVGTQLRMGPFTVQADGILTDERLKLIQGSVHSIDFKMVDAYGTGVDGTGTVVTAKVYNAAGFLVDTYTCTPMYALDGRYSFAIDSTVTNNVGMYTINISRQIGSEINVFGRMKLEVLSP